MSTIHRNTQIFFNPTKKVGRKICQAILIAGLFVASKPSAAQINEKQIGSWWMYFFNHHQAHKRFGFQGDVQLRNWGLAEDLEQLMLRGGASFSPIGKKWKFTQGYAHISTGKFGKSTAIFGENRIYQELLVPSKLGTRFYFNHRFRFEERFIDNQDFKTRFRYNLFLNISLSQSAFTKHVFYAALYNELFLNTQKEAFDRNRFYAALGFVIKEDLKTQFGIMQQSTQNWTKNQFQLSLHHNF